MKKFNIKVILYNKLIIIIFSLLNIVLSLISILSLATVYCYPIDKDLVERLFWGANEQLFDNKFFKFTKMSKY